MSEANTLLASDIAVLNALMGILVFWTLATIGTFVMMWRGNVQATPGSAIFVFGSLTIALLTGMLVAFMTVQP